MLGPPRQSICARTPGIAALLGWDGGDGDGGDGDDGDGDNGDWDGGDGRDGGDSRDDGMLGGNALAGWRKCLQGLWGADRMDQGHVMWGHVQ